MNEPKAQAHFLPWWAAGILLGLVQVLAIGLVKPMEVTSQFIAFDAGILENYAPEYAQSHPLINKQENKKNGYDLWFVIGIFVGALLTALHLRIWKLRANTVLWKLNHDAPIILRLIAGFCGGILLILGAGFALASYGAHFAGGWAQLAFSAVPFSIAAIGSGILAAYLVYPKTSVGNKHG